VSEVLDFLLSLFDKGLQYRTLNVYRSAISTTHLPVEGLPLGSHALVKRFMKGVFELRPALPKYQYTWDVSRVLSLLKSWSPARTLSIKQLTLKLVMLIALVSAGREQSLSLLDVRYKKKTSDGVCFTINRLSKTSRPGRVTHDIVLPSFPRDKRICPVFYLKEYVSRTRSFRLCDSFLFRAMVEPHQAVGSTTIARWLKLVLQEAGVDTNKFTGHSTRSAAVSAAALRGVSAKDIMKMANWSTSSTFEKFYRKPVKSCNFGRKILASGYEVT